MSIKIQTQSPVNQSVFVSCDEMVSLFANLIINKTIENDLMATLADFCSYQLGFGDCIILWVDSKRKLLLPRAEAGKKYADAKNQNGRISSLSLEKGIKGIVAKSGKPEIINDSSVDQRYLIDDYPRYSEIAVPIIMKNTVVGIIDCEHEEMNFFQPEHAHVLNSLTAIFSLKLAHIKEKESLIDQQSMLTELRNKRKKINKDSFRKQFSPHFVFNALNVIQHFITTNEKKKALGGLNKFSLLLRHYIDRYGYDEISVRDEINMLRVYMQLQELRYEGKLKIYTNDRYPQKALCQCIPSFLIASVLEDILERMMKRGKDHVTLWISFDEHAGAFQLKLRSTAVPVEKTVNPVNKDLLDYRLDLPTWKEQVEQLNQLEMFTIQYQEEIFGLPISQPSGVEYSMGLSVQYVNPLNGLDIENYEKTSRYQESEF